MGLLVAQIYKQPNFQSITDKCQKYYIEFIYDYICSLDNDLGIVWKSIRNCNNDQDWFEYNNEYIQTIKNIMYNNFSIEKHEFNILMNILINNI